MFNFILQKTDKDNQPATMEVSLKKEATSVYIFILTRLFSIQLGCLVKDKA
jgi:hypothetical protein